LRLEAVSLAGIDGIAHGFFGRQGGVSHGPFASLNVSLRNADQTAHALENRQRVTAALGCHDRPLLIARQVHGVHCEVVTSAFAADQPPEADALATRTLGLVLGVTSADCAPILFADPAAGVIAAAHAGWRGARDGIIEATLEAAMTLGAEPERLLAAIGPCIALTSYEVGAVFEKDFRRVDAASSGFFADMPGGKRHFDLEGYCASRLERAGIGAVERLGLDTLGDPDRFFSYRRTTKTGERHFGLQVSAIALA
jgi:hypothetical protein